MSYRIVAIGEVLWDMLPDGRQLGGAPANFTFHAHALGADARLISCVGEDELGRDVLDLFARRGLPTDTLRVVPRTPTGTVTVELEAGGVPKYTIHEGVAWDDIRADEKALHAVRSANAVCFGSLAQRTRKASQEIERLVRGAPPGSLRIFDVNLRPPFVDREVIHRSLDMANLLKLNDEELEVLAGMFELPVETRPRLEALAERFELSGAALTRGSAGSLLWRPGEWSDLPGVPQVVRDTVGAGDSFTATLALGLLHGLPLHQINRLANEVAAHVCSQAGGTPDLPGRFRQALEQR